MTWLFVLAAPFIGALGWIGTSLAMDWARAGRLRREAEEQARQVRETEWRKVNHRGEL